jgi:hypothetical protein
MTKYSTVKGLGDVHGLPCGALAVIERGTTDLLSAADVTGHPLVRPALTEAEIILLT